MTPLTIAAVLGAGALGAVLRFLATRLARPGHLPWPVLLVNVVGSAFAGLLIGLSSTGSVDPGLEVVLLSGFCGGLTTFSTFSVETIQLAIDGHGRSAVGNVATNLVLGLGACFAAYALVTM